jgi:dienelactone hydrolase
VKPNRPLVHRPLVNRIFPLALASLAIAVTPLWAQSVKTSPANPVLSGDPLSISLVGLPTNAEVKISSERAIGGWTPGVKRLIYRAEATYTASDKGEVDLATAIPKAKTESSYKRADVRGLFWSMTPTKTEAAADVKEGVVTLTASVDGKPVANGKIEFIKYAATLKIEKLEKFPGAIFASLPQADGKTEKRPALIVMGGSEGGATSVNDSARRFASRGFAVMSLPYYSPASWPSLKQEVPELPRNFVDIPVERLNAARDYLRSRPDVDGERIGIYGVSKGAEFVMLAATHFPWVKSAVAIVPSDVVWEGWGDDIAPGTSSSFALNGKPFAYTPYKDFGQEFMGYQTGDDVFIRRPQDKGRAANPAAAALARIPIERYKGSLMVVGGQDDQVWSSGMMAHNIAERRAEAKLETVSLIYSDAGHYLSGDGWTPTTQYNAGPGKSGGTPAGNAAAQGDAWVKTIEFLKRTMGVQTTQTTSTQTTNSATK